MLRELSKYQNLGTPSYYYELLIAFRDQPNEKWNEKKAKELFYNRVVDGRNIFDGCIPLLAYVEIIKIEDDGHLKPEIEFFSFLVSQNLMIDKLVERLMIKLSNDSTFLSIFSSEFISYDIVYKAVQIDNSAFSFKYSKFKQLLLDLGVIKSHPVKEMNKYIFNSRFKKLFDKSVLPEIQKRKIGIEALRVEMEQKQIHGEEAERFVLEYEKNRLNGMKEVNWVAKYSIADGYDIASYNDEQSPDHDRFIEVKSYKGKPYFFWSRNEMNVARVKKSNYFLYLVNRSLMDRSGYEPMIIQDPYMSVFKNEDEWSQRIEKIKFEIKN